MVFAKPLMTLLFGAFLLTACARPTEAPPAIDPALLGSTWILTSLDGHEPKAELLITLEFRNTDLFGSMPCNNYRAGPGDTVYHVSDGEIVWGLVSTTVELCLTPEGTMDYEKAYVEAFREVRAYEVTGDELQLFDGSGHVLLEYRLENP